jgi:hypothetical protein
MEYWEVAYMIIAAPRVMAVDNISTIATPHYANVSAYFINGTNETSAPPDYGMWFTNALQVYPDFLGPIAYLLIFFIPFGMIWMAHGDTRLISVLGLITGPFIILYLGGPWIAAAVIIMVLSAVALWWRITRP